MSYCRFSSDDGQCDVYVYEHYMGFWVTHVAGQKRRPIEPLPPPVPCSPERAAEWLARHKRVQEILDQSPYEPIGLPHDGESFEHATPDECAENLERLQALGYNVPQYAIDALREEAAEPATEKEE